MKKYIALFGLVSFLATSYYFFFVRSLPNRTSDIKISILEKPVDVAYDKNGIPHIKASNKADAYRAMGYVLAQHRLFQLDIQRRVATGRLSEILGEKTAEYDKMNRSLGFRYYGKKLAAEKNWSAETDTKIDAFLEGLNYAVKTINLPIEFKILKYKPDPFTKADIAAFIGYMSFSFQEALKQDPNLINLMAKLPQKKYLDLINAYENNAPSLDKTSSRTSAQTTSLINKSIKTHITRLAQKAMEQHETYGYKLSGSNAWVIDGKLSQSGKPMIANDPHIGHSNPGVWFEGSLEYPGKQIHGHFLSFIPFPVLGWTPDYAWSLTMSELDDMDFFLIQKNSDGKMMGYKDKELKYSVSAEVIHIKDQEAKQFDLIITDYGPLLDSLVKIDGNSSVAGTWTYYFPENKGIEGLSKMSEARNIDDFKNALSLLTAPGLSIAYADNKNNIAWFTAGRTLQRPSISKGVELRFASREPVPKLIPFEKNPHLINPPDSYIVNANHRLSNAQAMEFPGYYQPTDRARLIERKLKEINRKISLEDYRKLLNDNEDWFYPEVKSVFRKSMDYQSFRLSKVLQDAIAEDRQFADVNSHGFLLYRVWSRFLTREILVDELGDITFDILFKTPVRYNMYKKVSLDSSSPWWDNINTEKIESRDDILKMTAKKVLDFLEKQLGPEQSKWTWGRLHTYEAIHPLGRAKPLNHIFNLGPYPMPGAYSTINAQASRNKWNDFKVNSGPSTRRAIDLARPDWSMGILPHGNSGHLADKFHNNQFKDYVSGKLQIRKLSYQYLNQSDIDSSQVFRP